MITRVMGKVTDTYWYVEPNNHEERKEDGTVKFVFDKRPELKSDVVELEPVEICRYEGKPNMDIPHTLYFPTKIHIGDECVTVLEINFYADLDEYRQFVDKVVMNNDISKERAEKGFEAILRDYNKQSIEGDEKLLAYCRLHHLDPEETDVDELREVVCPQNTYKPSLNIPANEMNIITSDTTKFSWGTLTNEANIVTSGTTVKVMV